MSGVIAHVPNPTAQQAVELAIAAETAGARWIGLADAFWWRDVWMLLLELAEATGRIEIGPAMTNPYLRHPFHTASALATLHEAAPGRTFCGVSAGGSEVTLAAGIARTDAPERAIGLVELLRDVAIGAPLDADSGRTLDVDLPGTPILMAGRGDRMLAAAGAKADRVLLWAIPRSDLERSVSVIRAAATAAGREPLLIWAPLVRHPDVPSSSLGHPAVYAALNTATAIRESWGLGAATIASIRSALVGGQLADAIDLVPEAAIDDLVVEPSDTASILNRATDLGVGEIAVPGFSADTVADHLAWAARIEAHLPNQ